MGLPLDHIVIYASDLARSAAYYAEILGLLGFERTRDNVFARDGLAFDIRASTGPSPRRVRAQTGVDHVGFTAPDRAAVDRIAAHMRALGHSDLRILEFDDGDYALFVTDPDGVRLEITCYAG